MNKRLVRQIGQEINPTARTMASLGERDALAASYIPLPIIEIISKPLSSWAYCLLKLSSGLTLTHGNEAHH